MRDWLVAGSDKQQEFDALGTRLRWTSLVLPSHLALLNFIIVLVPCQFAFPCCPTSSSNALPLLQDNALNAPFKPNLEAGVSHVLFIGCDLDLEELGELMMASRPPLPFTKPLKTVESLNADEVQRVNKEKQTEPCPPGMYFTGSHWVNFYGEAVFEHPCLPDFLAEYVKEMNQEVVIWNQDVEEQRAAAAAKVRLRV